MELALTWDLLIIVFFAIVVSYSFIVGKDEAIRIIIASYISIVAVQAIGNMFDLLLRESQAVTGYLDIGIDGTMLSVGKLILFVGAIVAYAVAGGLETDYPRPLPGIWETAATAVCGFVTAGLLLSALLTYIAAMPLLDGGLAQAPFLSPIVQSSRLARVMVEYQNMWFALPAVLLLTVGIIGKRSTN